MTLAHLPSYGVPAALTMLAALALRLGFAGYMRVAGWCRNRTH